jgi:hypothetical protein
MIFWLRVLAIFILIGVILTACNSSDEQRPTEVRVITGEPQVEALQATINALETQQAAMASSTATPTPQPATRPSTVTEGVIIGGDAVVFAEAAINATEVGILPENTVVDILDESEPNRIGVVFYNVQYEALIGWVASTQIRLQEPQTVVVAPRSSQAPTAIPSSTNTATPFPTATFPPTTTPTITQTPLPPGYPTPQIYSVVLVEQLFERGRMIWFQPLREIWVLEGDEIDPREGIWTCFIDGFVDGMPERALEFDPPLGVTTSSKVEGAAPMQPIRGFGKVWRENKDIRDALGWALLPETLYTTRYQYNAGGEVVNGVFKPSAGEIRIESLFQETLVFLEDRYQIPCDQGKSGTWEIQ